MSKNNGNGQKRAHILAVRAKNIKCVREVAIDLTSGNILEIRGDTGQGKTTILQTIEGGLCGLDASMVRKGAHTGEIELHLDTATINRVVSAEDGKQTVMVKDAKGKPIQKAKEFLRALCGESSFRPVEWVQMGGGSNKGRTDRLRRQRDMLLEAIPMQLTARDVALAVSDKGDAYKDALSKVRLGDVDFNQHPFIVCSTLESLCYEYRKLQNSRAEDAESALKLTPPPARKAPDMSIGECRAIAAKAQEDLYSARAATQGGERMRAQAERLRAEIEAEEKAIKFTPEQVLEATEKGKALEEDTIGKIAELELALQEARQELQDIRARLDRCADYKRRHQAQEARRTDLAKILDSLGDEGSEVDLEALNDTYEQALANVDARQQQDAHNEAAQGAKEAKETADLYGVLVTLFRDELPKALLAQADLPVDGLGVEGDAITIHGIPIHQLGTSQQIRIGVQIAAALNPQSGFILVDGAESMGSKDKIALAQVADELGLQLIMTFVDPEAEPGPGVVVMEGGVCHQTEPALV